MIEVNTWLDAVLQRNYPGNERGKEITINRECDDFIVCLQRFIRVSISSWRWNQKKESKWDTYIYIYIRGIYIRKVLLYYVIFFFLSFCLYPQSWRSKLQCNKCATDRTKYEHAVKIHRGSQRNGKNFKKIYKILADHTQQVGELLSISALWKKEKIKRKREREKVNIKEANKDGHLRASANWNLGCVTIPSNESSSKINALLFS